MKGVVAPKHEQIARSCSAELEGADLYTLQARRDRTGAVIACYRIARTKNGSASER
jgi:hypothetical protein